MPTPIDQNIFAVNADNFSCGDIFAHSDISDNEPKHIFSNEEIQNLLTDYYKGEAQFKGNCQMGTENIIQSEVSLPDGSKFKLETNIQIMDTTSDANYSKFGQLQANDVCIPLNSAFWNKDEFNNKMLQSSQTENCPFTLGPIICIETVNGNCIDNICESSRSHIVQVHNYLVSSVVNPHWFVRYVKSCNTKDFDYRKINYGCMNGEVQLCGIKNKYQSKTSQNDKNTHKCVNFLLYNAQWCNIPSCKGHTILLLQVHIYAKSRKLYFTAYLCNEPSSR